MLAGIGGGSIEVYGSLVVAGLAVLAYLAKLGPWQQGRMLRRIERDGVSSDLARRLGISPRPSTADRLELVETRLATVENKQAELQETVDQIWEHTAMLIPNGGSSVIDILRTMAEKQGIELPAPSRQGGRRATSATKRTRR